MSRIVKILIMAILLSPVSGLPAWATEITFDNTGLTVAPGSTFAMQITANLSPGDELAGGVIDLGYDDSVVEILNVAIEPNYDFWPDSGSKAGTGLWEGIGFDVFDNPAVTADAIIATVTLEARGAGASALSILPSSQFFSTTVRISPTITSASITVNTAPVANNQAVTTDEDIAVAITLTGSDVEGDPLSFTVATGPTNGSLSGAAPNLTYTPNAGFSGSDGFTFTANDGFSDSNTATVMITVNAAPINNAPTAVDDSYSTAEDTTLIADGTVLNGVLLNDTDPESNPLTAVLDTPTTNGTLSLAGGGTFSYTPNFNFNGVDSFTYHANDGVNDSNVATVTITVSPVNDPPVALDDAYTADEDVPLDVAAFGVLANDTDAESVSLTSVVDVAPSSGTLTLSPDGSFSYTPNTGYNGSDSFTYKASDGILDSNVATVTITVNPINDAPVAADDAYATDEDTPLNVVAPAVLGNDTDVDGDALTTLLDLGPSNGSLTLNADGSFGYTPNAGFSGSDSFTYKANDGILDSNIGTVTITVNPINDAPLAADDAYSTNEDVPLNMAAPGVLANDSDPDGNPITAIQVTGPSNGTLALLADGSFGYTPNTGFNGSDSFTYKANDGILDSNIGTVTITVNPIDDAPLAADDAYTTDEDVSLNVTAPGVLSNDTDVNGDPLTAVLNVGPANGTLTLLGDGSLNYSPNAGFNGTDSFTYRASDGRLNSGITTVTIVVRAVNDAPVATDDAYATDEDVPLNVAAPGVKGNDSDPDGDSLSLLLVSGPDYGALTLNGDGSFTYEPDPDYFGPDTFTYMANDGLLNSGIATVTFTVDPVNDPPVADAGPDQTVPKGDTATLDASASRDVDGDGLNLTWTLISQPNSSNAILDITDPVRPTLYVDKAGNYVAQLIVNDGIEDSAPDAVIISTRKSAPVADAGPDQTVLVGDTVILDGSASCDVDGDVLDFEWTINSRPADSAAMLDITDRLHPTFVADRPGTYVAQLIVNDGAADSAPGTVTISTQNSAPVADAGPDQTVPVDDTVTLDGSASSDADGDGLWFIWDIIMQPVDSTVNLDATDPLYPKFMVDTPGTYVVQLIVNDGAADSVPDTVTISTQNSAPVADAGPDQTVPVGDTVILDGSASGDADGDELWFTWDIIMRPAGSKSIPDTTDTEQPTFYVDKAGTYVVQLTVNDGILDSLPDTMEIQGFDGSGEYFCPRGKSFWIHNPEQWAVQELFIGDVLYYFEDLMAFLEYGGPDKPTRLGRHLVATKLNLAAGSDPVILAVVDEADAFLTVYPPGSDPMEIDKAVLDDLKDQLEHYNDASCEGN